MNGHLQDGNQCREVWKYTPGKLDEAQVGALLALAPLAPSWFCWGDKWKNADGQPKAPGNPNDMKPGNAANMETAASLDTALSKLNQAGVAGVGLALKGATSGLLLLDLGCIGTGGGGPRRRLGIC